MSKYVFDVIVIGSGSAGVSAAHQANELGANVCIIEKDAWGGECPNFACIPTKAMLKSARSYYFAKHGLSDLGVYAPSATYNFRNIMKRKDAVVDVITGEGKRVKKGAEKAGIKTFRGTAVFEDENTVKVGSKKITGKKFIIATGTKDVIPPIEGIDEAGYLTYKDAVSLKQKPESLVIIGGGPVGCEFATFFTMLETKVTLIQLDSSILNREDEEVSSIAMKHLQEIGVNVFVNSKALSVEKAGRKIKLVYQEKSKKRKAVTVDRVLLAAGKRANIESLHLDNARVELNKDGALKLNDYLQTSQSHIFAAGDVSGGLMFTHTAHEEGVIAGTNVMKKTKRSMKKRDLRVVPRVTFVSPEVASVGMTVSEAKENANIAIGKFSVGALGRAVTESERVGLVKLIVDKGSRNILGGHIVAERAGEMIHEVALAMRHDLTVDDVANTIHAFPTYSEAVAAAAASV